MKRLVAALGLMAVLALSSCTPAEHAAWSQWFDSNPTEAQSALESLPEGVVQPHSTFATPASAPAGSKCPQWYDEAMAAGFTPGQWRTVDYIMFRESRCQPGAHNAAGANGLMQIMNMWADDCGTTPSGLRTAMTNLRCAVHVKEVQGWEAWSTYN